MLLKFGVDISRLDRQIRRALNHVNIVYANDGQEVVVTSTYEGDHSPSSLHYGNDAFDIRKPKRSEKEILAELRRRLGNNYDIVAEKTHWHIEWDPK
jgi:hypothetical protein